MVSVSQDSGGDYGWQLNTVNWPLVLLSGVFLFTRIFLKVFQRRDLWWDDRVLILSWATLASQSAIWTVMVSLGYGNELVPIAPENVDKVDLLLQVGSTLLIMANLWGKTSFAITLLRLPLGWTRSIVWFLLITMNIILSLSAFFVWTQCYRFGVDTNTISGIKCLPRDVATYYSVFSGAYSAVVDFTLAVVPCRFLWTLQMKSSEKIGITLAMTMGIFAGITAIIKTTIFPKLTTSLGAGIQIVAWGVVESSVSIMAACIPILRALVRQGSYPPQMGYETGQYASTHPFGGPSSFLATTFGSTRPLNSLRRPSAPDDAQADERPSSRGLGAKKRKGSKDSAEADPGLDKHDDWDEPDVMSYEMTNYSLKRTQSNL